MVVVVVKPSRCGGILVVVKAEHETARADTTGRTWRWV
jgi:hypothetical protein